MPPEPKTGGILRSVGLAFDQYRTRHDCNCKISMVLLVDGLFYNIFSGRVTFSISGDSENKSKKWGTEVANIWFLGE